MQRRRRRTSSKRKPRPKMGDVTEERFYVVEFDLTESDLVSSSRIRLRQLELQAHLLPVEICDLKHEVLQAVRHVEPDVAVLCAAGWDKFIEFIAHGRRAWQIVDDQSKQPVLEVRGAVAGVRVSEVELHGSSIDVDWLDVHGQHRDGRTPIGELDFVEL